MFGNLLSIINSIDILRNMDETELFSTIQSIEKRYLILPWPKIKTIAFLACVCGGLGDIITSRKAISIIKK